MEGASFFSFFKNLLHENFMPHGHCYFWRPDVLWLNVISDGLIALSYYAIPVILIFFLLKRKDFPFPWVLFMFGAFILLCGTTHVMGIVTVWDPLYRLDGIIKGATAFVSVLTTIMLVPLIPLALALKSPKELEAANQKLADANEKLKEIDRLKDNFFSNISHELRTPLTLILAPLESFLANDYGPVSELQHKNLEAMHNNSIRLFQMVNSILDFAKISAKKIEVKREPQDIVLLTQSIAQEFNPIVKQKNIKIDFNCAEQSRIVDIDRYLYERILFNLLSNAAKFTPENGSISITLSFDKDEIILSVRDTGIGISDTDQEKLFQRFQQVEGSATRRFEGTGLGLALVKEFALLLGGDVKVKSAIGKGSTFIVDIKAPLSDTSKQVVTKTLESKFQKYDIKTPVPVNKLDENSLTAHQIPKILIAEDNLELATYITSLLGEFAEVRHAKDGEEAWETVKVWEPDLVVLDVMMPKKDGITVCREIKSSSKTAHIPVILLTALTHRDALLRGWEAGANEYLFKPFHPKELTTRIKLLLSFSHNAALVQSLNRKLIISARLSGMSEVATNILHNVGNLLNSIRVSTDLLLEKLSHSEIKNLEELIKWVEKTLADPAAFISDKQTQENFKLYLDELNKTLLREQNEWIEDAITINKYIKDIKEIIALPEKVAERYGVVETVNVPELIESVLVENLDPKSNIHVIKEFDNNSDAVIDKMRLQEILMNLVRNANESLQESHQSDKKLTIKTKITKVDGQGWMEIDVSDNGVGISPEGLSKIFTFGFTTKSDGRGLGLHISNLSAEKMGGKLTVKSQGKNRGATFSLRLPLEPPEADKWIKIVG